MWPPIVPRRYVQAMPVECGFLGEVVLYAQRHAIAQAAANGRAQVGTVDADGRGRDARQEFGPSTRNCQVECSSVTSVRAIQDSGDPERVGEAPCVRCKKQRPL